MPRLRALRSTVEIAALFSTLTAMTSTPRVIQRLDDFVLPAGIEIRRTVPDQRRRPS